MAKKSRQSSTTPAAASSEGGPVPKVTVDEKDDGVRLVVGMMGLGKGKVDVVVVKNHGAPTAKLPSGASVTGPMTIAKYLITLSGQHPDLLGKIDVDKANVEKQIDAAIELGKEIQPKSLPASDEDRERAEGILEKLDGELAGKVFFVANYLTLADVFLYGALYVEVATMSSARRVKFSNVTRYFDLIQNLIAGFGKEIHLQHVLIDLDVDESLLVSEKKKDAAPAAAQGGKKDKGKKEKGGEAAAVDAKAKPEADSGKKKAGAEEGAKKDKKEKKADAAAPKPADAKAATKDAKAAETPAAASAEPAAELPPGEPERLDLRVGKIVSVQRHAQADTLYVEEVDVGEDKPRTVVSGLVKYMKESDLQDKLVVLLCNLKPVKMRGVESQAMVLAATSVDGTTVELLEAPKGSKPGDRCWFDTHIGTDFSQLNAKKKIWEGVQPRLKTDTFKRASYVVDAAGVKTVSLLRNSHGEITVKSIVGGSIK
ncbi:Aminoacyl tRNA synthase complex-interacting multifunctional protein 1 [Phlyctochytrium planicorne]|nr:Aminoacyl tRNA synthase complex-interacting multifunctional protein 1 [Phlyctochytrium planicorne]